MKEKFKFINQSLNKNLGIGWFSAGQLLWSGGVFVTTLFLSHALLGLSLYIGLLLSTWLGLTVAFLSGSKPYRFWSQIYPFIVPHWIRGQVRQVSPISRERLGAKKVRVNSNTSQHVNPIEDWLHLLTLCRIQPKGAPPVACYILCNEAKGADLSNLNVKFPFVVEGINPCIASQQELSAVITHLETLFKDIDTSFIFRWRSFCDYADTSSCSVNERLHNPVSVECCYLDHATIARTKELVKDKQRKKVSLSVEVILKPHLDTTTHRDWFDRWIDSLKAFWHRRIENKGRQIDEQQLISILKQAYNAAQRYHQALTEAGLKPKFQSETELWQELRRRVGGDTTNLPSSVLVLDSTGLHEQFLSPDTTNQYPKLSSSLIDHWSSSTKLVQRGVPFADRKWVCIPTSNGKHKYVGLLVLEDKCAGFLGDEGQLLYWWNILSRDNIYNVELVTELSPANSNLVRLHQQFLTRNSISRDEQAQVKGTVEVGAQLNLENSIEAQRQLYTGDVPLYASVVVLVYRDSPQELDEVCRYLSGLVKQPANLIRETNYAWLIWLQTTGLRKEALLGTPYFRRLMFFASEVLGVCNLVQVPRADTQGIELLANESSLPVHIDLSVPKNFLVLGTTGSGKSILVASMIAECLALGMSFVIIDLPNADGSGTFGDLTHFFNGFYFDISRESNNIMQRLNLAHIDVQEREWRIQAHMSDVILIVTQLILGSTNSLSGFLTQTIESVIPLIIRAFYEDTEIQQRFSAAESDGFASSAWSNTPTLKDLFPFVSSDYIDLGYQDSNLQQALNHIKLRLQYWINSWLGRAISQPSSFDSLNHNCKLITFALTNLQTDTDAEIFGLSAFLAASSQTLSSSASAFFIDESSVLLRFSALAQLAGRKCATSRKSGCRVILAGQDVASIASCETSEQILQNTACRLIGRIEPSAMDSFQDVLKIPNDIISQNVIFQSKKGEGYTRWLLDYQNTYIQCRYYPSWPLLALTVNNPEERAAREKFKAKYSNKLEYLTAFYRWYKQQLKQGGIQ